MTVRFTHSLVLDALALIEHIAGNIGADRYEEAFWRKAVNRLCDDDAITLPNDVSMSVLSSLLATVVGPTRLEQMSLSELHSLLGNTEELRDTLANGESGNWHGDYVRMVDRLEQHQDAYEQAVEGVIDAGFTEYWNARLLSGVQDVCRASAKKIETYDLTLAQQYLSDLNGTEMPDQIVVFGSYCSHPISYYLCEGAFLQNCEDMGDPRYIIRTIVHELFHGFASPQVVAAHRRLIHESEYLSEVMRDNEWSRGIGPEEMYVKATELYIVREMGLYSRKEVLTLIDGLYGNSLPLTVVVFDLLSRGPKRNPPPLNVSIIAWIEDGRIDCERLDQQCDRIIPGYSRRLDKSIACHEKYLEKLRNHRLL